jgi:hypothetical protein
MATASATSAVSIHRVRVAFQVEGRLAVRVGVDLHFDAARIPKDDDVVVVSWVLHLKTLHDQSIDTAAQVVEQPVKRSTGSGWTPRPASHPQLPEQAMPCSLQTPRRTSFRNVRSGTVGGTSGPRCRQAAQSRLRVVSRSSGVHLPDSTGLRSH